MGRWAAVFLLISLVAACTTVEHPADLPRWQLQGKLSVRTASDASILSINWSEYAGHSEINLRGPLGITVADISADATGFVINTSEGRRRFTNEEALELPDGEQIRLPWRFLATWVRGLDKNGAPIGMPGLQTDGWSIRVLKRSAEGPRLMVFEHQAVTLRLQVREWKNL